MRDDTAGDPISGLKWTRKTTRKLATELRKSVGPISARTVARLLKQLGYSLRANQKKISQGSPVTRDRQFGCIRAIRERFERRGLPIVSVDTKKKELVGRFKNQGVVWGTKPILVNDHDFRSTAEGMAIPYGIYDVQRNRGHVVVGKSHDTSEFAVRSIADWWLRKGRRTYRNADQLLILADNGGSNGSRIRAWKHELQTFCDKFSVSISVCHYPPGGFKWNLIEHRLFSEISKNWRGGTSRQLRDDRQILAHNSNQDRPTRYCQRRPPRLFDRQKSVGR